MLKYASITAVVVPHFAHGKPCSSAPCCNICGNPRCCPGFSQSFSAFWCWLGQAITIVVAAIFFGAYLLVTGISQVVFAFSLHVSAGGRVLLFISGAAALILAVLCFRSLQESILLLAIWIGVGFIFRGVATAVSAISDPDTARPGVGDLHRRDQPVAGVVMLASPFESIATLTVVVGIWLIVIGVFEVVSAFGIRKASKDVAAVQEKLTTPPPAEPTE